MSPRSTATLSNVDDLAEWPPGAGRNAPTARLVLMRHGETTWNRQGLIQGQSDAAVLTALGRLQVGAAVPLLSGRVDAIVASDLRRAEETARIVADALGLGVRIDPGLRERSYGSLEGAPLDELVRGVVGVDARVVVDQDARAPGGESLRELYDRTVRAARRVAAGRPGRRTLVVTHGGPIRMIRAYCEGRVLVGLAWEEIDNASLWPVDLPT
jgi:broad specificity phosphatase PhoE